MNQRFSRTSPVRERHARNSIKFFFFFFSVYREKICIIYCCVRVERFQRYIGLGDIVHLRYTVKRVFLTNERVFQSRYFSFVPLPYTVIPAVLRAPTVGNCVSFSALMYSERPV